MHNAALHPNKTTPRSFSAHKKGPGELVDWPQRLRLWCWGAGRRAGGCWTRTGAGTGAWWRRGARTAALPSTTPPSAPASPPLPSTATKSHRSPLHPPPVHPFLSRVRRDVGAVQPAGQPAAVVQRGRHRPAVGRGGREVPPGAGGPRGRGLLRRLHLLRRRHRHGFRPSLHLPSPASPGLLASSQQGQHLSHLALIAQIPCVCLLCATNMSKGPIKINVTP